MTAPPKAKLGFIGTTSLVVGSVVGSGIFLTPAIVAGHLPTPSLILAVWLVSGILSVLGALTFAELGGMFPRAGGQYLFLREAFGRPLGFLFGWMALAVNYSGTIAAIAVAFAAYLGTLLGYDGVALKLAAIAGIWLLTLVNIAGLRAAGAVQVSSTGAKIAALIGLVVLGFLLGAGPDPSYTTRPSTAPGPLLAAFGLGLVPALFAFDGLVSATFLGEEIRRPERTIPRATVLGALIVTALYVAVNAAFLHALPVADLANNGQAASDVGRTLLGGPGGFVIALAVVVATFGALNGYVLQSPRIYVAMARDAVLYRSFARLGPASGMPVFGLIIQAEWSSLLVLSGTYEQLITYVVVSSWLFYGLTGLALFRLRAKRPNADRPFRIWGYPVVPGLFVLSAFLLVANALWFSPRDSLIGILLALSGLPVYFFVRGRGGTPTPEDTAS